MTARPNTQLEREMRQLIKRIELMSGEPDRQLDGLLKFTYRWMRQGIFAGFFMGLAASAVLSYLFGS